MKLIIAGSRGYNYYEGLKASFYQYILDNDIKLTDVLIISGGARGPDMLGIQLAQELGLEYRVFNADWSTGKSAGMRRNEQMADQADGLLAIWDGRSSGTRNMVELAEARGLLTKIIYF